MQRALLLALAAIAFPGLAHADTPSFVNDVQPIFTRLGCNQGACHGIPSGRGGFKLSLRGYDPSADFTELTRQVLGRRTNRIEPESSLILQKALGRVPHEGGQRFARREQR